MLHEGNAYHGVPSKPLDIASFIDDIHEVFRSHGVISIKGGFIGEDADGKFGIAESDIRLAECERCRCCCAKPVDATVLAAIIAQYLRDHSVEDDNTTE